jgi:hypothetical protein
MDVEVTERSEGRGGLGYISSSFYKRVIQMWCPLPMAEKWAEDGASGAGEAFLDMAVCFEDGRGGSKDVYGVDFGTFMSGGAALRPSYTVTPGEMDFINSVLDKELEAEIPSLSPHHVNPLESVGAQSTAGYQWGDVEDMEVHALQAKMYEKLHALEGRFPAERVAEKARMGSPQPPQAFYKGYASYTLDPGEVTDTLIDWLEHILAGRCYGFYSFSCKLFTITDHVCFIELRLYNSDFGQL